MKFKCEENKKYTPHPEGIYPAVCVDVIDLGMEDVTFQDHTRSLPKIRITFETEAKMEDGRPYTISRKFTASLHEKSNLNKFLSKWRGRAIAIDEEIDSADLLGVSATLVISHTEGRDGSVYATIDAIAKPTKKLLPSGKYDPDAARKRIEDRKAKEAKKHIADEDCPPPEPGTPDEFAPNEHSEKIRKELTDRDKKAVQQLQDELNAEEVDA